MSWRPVSPGSLANLATVGEQLGDTWVSYKFRQNPSTWEETLAIDHGRGIVGEIRSPEDWNRVPRETKLRAVYFEDSRGPHIRWGSCSEMWKIFPEALHD